MSTTNLSPNTGKGLPWNRPYTHHHLPTIGLALLMLTTGCGKAIKNDAGATAPQPPASTSSARARSITSPIEPKAARTTKPLTENNVTVSGLLEIEMSMTGASGYLKRLKTTDGDYQVIVSADYKSDTKQETIYKGLEASTNGVSWKLGEQYEVTGEFPSRVAPVHRLDGVRGVINARVVELLNTAKNTGATNAGRGELSPRDALKALQSMAEQGDSDAQVRLAQAFVAGTGESRDAVKAVEWFQKAAELGNAAAQSSLADMLAQGMGTTQDFAQAINWWRKAAEQGYATAQCNLGAAYGTGTGIPRDLDQAVRWYRKAAEQGHSGGQYNLGFMYYKGDGVPKDHAEAAKWWRKAASQGNVECQHNLGVMYAAGDGVPKDTSEAAKWWSIAAENGNARAAAALRDMKTSGSN